MRKIYMNSPEGFTGPAIPVMSWQKELLFDPINPLLIGDVTAKLKPDVRQSDFDNAVESMIASAFTRDALYFNANRMDIPFSQLVTSLISQSDVSETLLVFPGNGASVLKAENPGINALSNRYPSISLDTKRVFSGNTCADIRVNVTEEQRNVLRNSPFKNIVIIDDVISRGNTINTIRKELSKDITSEPAYFAFAWFLKPNNRVTQFKTLSSLYSCRTTDGYPAINSLSTWLTGDEKSQEVLTRYAQRFIRYPYGFKKSLELLKGMTTYE